MHLSAHLDLDAVALQVDDEISVLLEITAPAMESTSREPATLQVVLDRSGSMADGKLAGAQRALLSLLDRLSPTDNFGLVAFDDQTTVVVPAGPLGDKRAAQAAVAALRPGGSTNLSSGYLRGLQEARRVSKGTGATLLLVSDGHANAGITGHDELGGLARHAADQRITTSTLGYGLGYDEALLSALARGGSGNQHFAADPDAAGALIASEVDGLLAAAAQAANLLVLPEPPVESVTLFNDLPAAMVEGGVMVEIGDLYAGETRKLLLRLVVPGMAVLGLATIARLQVTWVDLPGLVSRTATLPVAVNVVPGDEAARRVPDPVVRSEVAYQEAQRAKQSASQALRAGDAGTAAQLFGAARRKVEEAAACAPPALRAELAEESQVLAGMEEEASWNDTSALSKRATSDHHRKNRQRGRGSR